MHATGKNCVILSMATQLIPLLQLQSILLLPRKNRDYQEIVILLTPCFYPGVGETGDE